MLRHSQNTSDNTSAGYNSSGYNPSYASATSEPLAMPYTPEEIANAIAEIERERYARNAAQNGTAQIAMVLEHMNLDMSATDVAARIEKQRLARVPVQKMQRNRRPVVVALIAALSCLGIFLGAGLLMVRGTAVTVQPPLQEAVTVTTPAEKAAIEEGTPVQDQAAITAADQAAAARIEAEMSEKIAAGAARQAAQQARMAERQARDAAEQARMSSSR